MTWQILSSELTVDEALTRIERGQHYLHSTNPDIHQSMPPDDPVAARLLEVAALRSQADALLPLPSSHGPAAPDASGQSRRPVRRKISLQAPAPASNRNPAISTRTSAPATAARSSHRSRPWSSAVSPPVDGRDRRGDERSTRREPLQLRRVRDEPVRLGSAIGRCPSEAPHTPSTTDRRTHSSPEVHLGPKLPRLVRGSATAAPVPTSEAGAVACEAAS